ncbi:hypothetical protein VNI00_006679 [Paramarasmius palmivorus]|uniref:F-box domain-containing protein n=1 Tax=Paramarasmius palmivorus TaxID=297713 RepID=A0AAW0D543_9AGAR
MESARCPQCNYSTKFQPPIPDPSEATIRLAQTNEPPPSNMLRVFSTTYLDSCACLEDVSNQILQMETSLKALREEQTRLRGIAKTYKQILHPIRRLPPEILREIFQLVERADHRFVTLDGSVKRSFLRNTLSSSRFPWILGQVSHLWREVALSCMDLWSNIGFELPDTTFSQEALARMVAQLMLQIQRSGTQPLSIHMKSHHKLSACNPLLVTICAHSTRWENLYLRLAQDGPGALQLLGTMIKGNIPNLQRLRLVSNTEAGIPDNTVCDAFSIAPQLHRVIIFDSPGFSRYLRIGWNQMTHAYVNVPEVEELSSTLKRLHNVRYLSLMYQKRDIFDGPPVTLPHLRTLFIIIRPSKDHTVGVNTLLERLFTPNLHDLRLSIKGTKAGSFPQFLTRSVATLRNFSLKAEELTSRTVIQLLECVPGLESLLLWGACDEVLNGLAEMVYTGKPRVVPELQVLGLFGEKKFADPSLVALVGDRIAGGSQVNRLRKVELESTLGVSEETVVWLRDAVQVDVVGYRDAWTMPNV